MQRLKIGQVVKYSDMPSEGFLWVIVEGECDSNFCAGNAGRFQASYLCKSIATGYETFLFRGEIKIPEEENETETG